MRTSFATLTVAAILALSAIADAAAPGKALKIRPRDGGDPTAVVRSTLEGTTSGLNLGAISGQRQGGGGATTGNPEVDEHREFHQLETPTNDDKENPESPENPETPATPHHSDPNSS